MTTKQRFFSSALHLELIFLLLYMWVRVTSPFSVQLITSVSFLTVSSRWRNRWTNSVNWSIWRSGGLVQSDSIFLLKLPELLFPLLFSLGLIIAMLSLLALLRFSLIKSRVINCLAHLIYKAPKSAHITPLLFDLHWLLISSRIQDKIALTCFHIISGTAPPYLSELLHLYSPCRSLRSASDTRIFRVPRVCRRILGERSFQCIGPVIWNSLSFSVRHATSLSSFKSKLKTHLFFSAYWFISFFLLFP